MPRLLILSSALILAMRKRTAELISVHTCIPLIRARLIKIISLYGTLQRLALHDGGHHALVA
jgi:hypothetical protein